MYRSILTLSDLQNYLSGAHIVAFDFETAPDEQYRREDKAALDAHKSHITGISFSIAEGDAVYLPIAHRNGSNAENLTEIWNWLSVFFADPAVTKVAHNLAFESASLYARGIVVQEPCYDTIAAAQLIYKNEKEFRTLGECGLKTLVPEYFHEELPTFSEVTGGRHFDELNPQDESTIRYACADSDYTPKVSRSPGMYTRFGVWTIDALDVYSGEKVSNTVLCNITACGAPTSIDISPLVAESTATLRWSGASGGAGNAITGYEVQYQNSSDGSYWGNWTFYGTMPTTDGFYTVEVNAPPTRGSYRRFRVRTKGTAGETYYSPWVISNSYRKNVLATPPTSFTASPLVYESGSITLTWSGTVAGTSAIKRYVIQQATSDNNSAWGDWTTLTTVTTSEPSGNATVMPPATWKYLRFRISVTDTLSGVSPYTTSNSIKKNIPPSPVIIEAPKAGGVTYNTRAKILIETQAEPDGLPQTIYVTATDGRTYNSKDNPAMFSTSGSSANSVKTVFTNPQSVFAAYNISVYCKDEYSSGTAVTRTFRISQTNFDTITAKITHLKARHITDLRFAVNNIRGYYNLPIYAWEHEIVPGRTNAAYWVYHVVELRAAIQGVVDKINTFGAIIPKISWLPLGNGRPRADVMAQLASVIIGL